MKIITMLLSAIAVGLIMIASLLLAWIIFWLFAWLVGYLVGLIGLLSAGIYIQTKSQLALKRIYTTLWRTKHVQD